MTAQELKAIAEGLAPVVRDQIRLALEQERAAFKKTIAGLEQRLLEIETTPELGPVTVKGEKGADGISIVGPQGERGETGPAGKDAAPVNIPSLIAAVLAAMPDPEKGERGEPGPAGKDAPAVDVEALVARVAAIVPIPKDGRDGKDAAPIDLDQLVARVASLVPAPKDGQPGIAGKDGLGLTGAVIDRSGHLIVTLTDGSMEDVGLVVGKDGADAEKSHVEHLVREEVAKIPHPKDGRDGIDGRNGADGLGFDDMDLVLDEVKGYVFRLTNGDRTKDYPVPWPWDAKIWQAGRDYFKGASVTWDGHFWIAQRATSEQPGEGSTAWRLAVRRGKQGREGKKGDKGDPAPPQGPVFG